MLDWNNIDTVLLDMDGTLLDLYFDNYFWSKHLPQRYADIHGGSLEEVSEQLMSRIMAERGSLNWYCLDYWSEQLQVDIPALKQEISHLINAHPSTYRLLEGLHHSHCETWLVTNAHRASLDLKLANTDLEQWMQRIVVSHDFSRPKEDPLFWRDLAETMHFDPARSLLIDDTHSVLEAAAEYGIKHLVTLRQPDSSLAIRDDLRYPAIHSFDEILPISAIRPKS